jgi:peptidoglycan/LPS O-acetylase OafA/YrhL
MPDTASGSARRFIVLDGLRGVAAMVVIVDHVPSVTLRELLPSRYLAVDFFFVLSGFVLSHVYGSRLLAGMPPLGFVRKRAIRFYPLYLAATILGALTSVLIISKGWVAGDLNTIAPMLLFNLAFLPCPPPIAPVLFPFVSPAWSLFCELLINLVYALIAPRLSNARLAIILAIAAPVLAATVFAFGNAEGGWAWDNFVVGLARVTFSFFAGVMVYRLYLMWMPTGMPASLAIVVLVAIFMVPAAGGWRAIYDVTAEIVLFPALVGLAAGSSVGAIPGRACLAGGFVSYGVYVLQAPLKAAVEVGLGALFRVRLEDLGSWAVLLILVLSAAATAIGNASYEVPLRRWLMRFGAHTRSFAADENP